MSVERRRYTDDVPGAIEARVRELCLSLPDAHEERAWVGTRRMVRKRTFANVLGVEDPDRGPMVIDWANASAGDPAFDVADTWVLFACGTPPLSGVDSWIVPIGRRVLLRCFLSRVDATSARRAIPTAVEHRLGDPNMSSEERARMRKFAARMGA